MTWYTETPTGIQTVRQPGFEEYCASFGALVHDRDMFPWRFLDMWAAGEQFGEEQAGVLSSVPEWSERTLLNVLNVGKHIKCRYYVGKVSFEHHRTVAKKYLDEAEQRFLLKEAYEKHLTVVELRRLLKAEVPRAPLAVCEYHIRRAISALGRALETAPDEAKEVIEGATDELQELITKSP
jgi:hypothetical protein